MQAVLNVLAWLAMPAHFVIFWPIFTGLASLAYTQLDATSWGHKVLSTLAGLGLDLPKLLAIAKSAFGGGGGSGSANDSSKLPSQSVKPGPNALRFGFIAALCIAIPCMPVMTATVGCNGANAPTSDVWSRVIAAIVRGLQTFEDIAEDVGVEIGVVVDIVNALEAKEPSVDSGLALTAEPDFYAKVHAVHHKAGAK